MVACEEAYYEVSKSLNIRYRGSSKLDDLYHDLDSPEELALKSQLRFRCHKRPSAVLELGLECEKRPEMIHLQFPLIV